MKAPLSYGLGPVRDAATLGGRVGRAVSASVADAAGRTALAGLDAVLDWTYTDEAVRRVLASALADRAIGHAFRGPLVDAAARDVVRYAVLERVADHLLDEPELERLATQVIESRLMDAIVDRLLESEELWLLVEEVARSPAVTAAIGQQSAGFADQVAGQMRLHSQQADAGLERVARRLLRRRPRPSGAAAETGTQ
jgi:hypothetical protein